MTGPKCKKHWSLDQLKKCNYRNSGVVVWSFITSSDGPSRTETQFASEYLCTSSMLSNHLIGSSKPSDVHDFKSDHSSQFVLSFLHTASPIALLTPSGAKERTIIKNKNTQIINISPLRGDHTPEPIDMPLSLLTPVADVIIPAKFYIDPLRGFWEGAPPKVPFPILFGTTVTTVLHYRADCDIVTASARALLSSARHTSVLCQQNECRTCHLHRWAAQRINFLAM